MKREIANISLMESKNDLYKIAEDVHKDKENKINSFVTKELEKLIPYDTLLECAKRGEFYFSGIIDEQKYHSRFSSLSIRLLKLHGQEFYVDIKKTNEGLYFVVINFDFPTQEEMISRMGEIKSTHGEKYINRR